MDSKIRRQLRKIAHHLQPVVIVGDAGVSATVINETVRALRDHELIKVKINAADREGRNELSSALIEACEAQRVQSIGKIIVLYRPNPDPDPHLSNLSRATKPLAG